jgi:hypothetical protein
MQISATAPSLFTLDQSGSGPAAALDSFTFTGAPFAATRPNGEPNIIALYGTGLGEDATDGGGNVSGSIEATINGLPMTVEYAGRAPGFVGLNQFNIVLPVGIGPGTFPLVVSRQGVQSNAVMITIEGSGAQVIYSAQATPNVFGPVCNILYYCENIVVVSGRNFSAAATVEIRAGIGGGAVAEYLHLRSVRPDVIDFILDSGFSPSVIYSYGGLLVTVINPGGKRSNSVKIMWGGGDHPDS